MAEAMPIVGFKDDTSTQQIAQEMVKTEPTSVPTFGDVLYGGQNMVGGQEIPSSMIQMAIQNPSSEQANYIREQIDRANAMQSSQAGKVRIAGTVADPQTGVVSPGIPEQYQNIPEQTQEKLKEYGASSIRLMQQIQGSIPDKRVQQILIDKYDRRNAFVEIGRRTNDFLTTVGGSVVNGGVYLGMMGAAAAEAAFDEDREFSQVWNTDYKSDADRTIAELKTWYETNIGASSHANYVNEMVKEEFIKRHGKEEYDKLAVLDLGMGDMPPVEGRLIPEELGQQLLDYGFSELTGSEQILTTLYETAAPSTALGKMHIASGVKKLRKVEEAMQIMPALKGLDPVTAYRVLRLEEKNNGFSRLVAKTMNAIGNKTGYRGSIGNQLEIRSHRTALSKLDTQIQQVRSELRSKKTTLPPDSAELKRLQTQLDSLQGRYNRVNFKGAFGLKNPFAFTLAVDESLVAMGQVGGYNLAEELGYDKNMGGMFGALYFAFLGKPTVKAPFKIASGLDNIVMGGKGKQVGVDMIRAVEDAAGLLPIINKKPELLKGFLRTSEFDFIEAELGRKLMPSEVASFKAASSIMKNLPEDQRQQVFESMQSYVSLKNRLVNAFDEDQKEKVDELLTMTFGHVTGLAPLQAMEVGSFSRIRGTSFEDAVQAQVDQERSLRQTNELLGQLKGMLTQRTGIDSEDTRFFQDWVTGVEKAADQQRLELGERKREYLGLLREYKDTILADPLTEVDDTDLVKRLADIETYLTPGAMDSVEAKRAIFNATLTDVQKALNERYKNLRALEGTPNHRRMLGQTLEMQYDAHISAQYAKGKQAYAKASEAIGDAKLNITPFIKNFVDSAEDIPQKDLMGLFSAEQAFFSGRSGRVALRAFNDMALRSLQRNMELDEEDLSELFEYVSTRTLKNGKTNPDYIENPSPIKVAIHFAQKEGSEFSPFDADPFEVDTVYRHFRNMGESIRDESVARQYKNAASELNTLIMSDEKIGGAVNAARKEYKAEIFDISRKGTYGDKLDRATSLPAYERIEALGYKRPYAPGQSPEEWHKDFGVMMGRAIDGKGVLPSDIKLQMDDLRRFWADDFVDGQFVFDLTSEAGQAKFDALSSMLRANLHEYWMKGRLNKAAGDIMALSDSPSAKISGYDFTILENIRNVQESLRVKVLDKDTGKIVERDMFSMDDIISEQNELEKLMKANKQLQRQYTDFTTELNNRVSDTGDAAVDRAMLDQRVVQQLEKAANVSNPKQFYETYVLNQNVGKIRNLRQNFIANLPSDANVNEAMQEFDDGVQYMIFNGLLESANVGPYARKTLTAQDGKKATMNIMHNPEVILSSLDDANIVQILEEVGMDADHIKYMGDMADFLVRAGGVERMRFELKGGVRAISPNEIISRSFNIARGMVSPTYVAAEFAFRLMSQNNHSALQLAASNKRAAEIMVKLLDTPEDIADSDIRDLLVLTQSFLVREAYKQGKPYLTQFVPSDDIAAAQAELERERENNETIQ